MRIIPFYNGKRIVKQFSVIRNNELFKLTILKRGLNGDW